MTRGFSIARLSTLACAAWLCVGGAKVYAEDFTSCGELVFIPAEGGCLHFTPNDGFFPFGLQVFPTVDFGLRGHVRVSGVLELDCVTTCGLGVPCIVDAVVETCNVPAVSDWGLAVLALLTVAAGTIVIRRRANRMFPAAVILAAMVFP